jgi:predicted negative regulator of RcsB-dependent stress response
VLTGVLRPQKKGTFFALTRHDLKDQLEHDQFTDAVTGAVSYTKSHSRAVIRWVAVAVAVAVVVGGIWGYLQYQKTQRENDLAEAMSVTDAQIGPPNDFSKTYPTQAAKDAAAERAFSEVVAKDGSSNEGMIALYYLATQKAKTNQAAAEPEFKRVADSGSDVAPLAKIALAQIYAGEKKTAAAQDLLRSIINDPTDLVSKAQAQILLAQTEATTNPQDARGVLKMIDSTAAKRPAISRASEAVSAQLK